MHLSRLAEGFDIRGTGDPQLTGLSEDSRRITPGMLFVAVPGTVEDGHTYLDDAVSRGAAAVVTERAAATVVSDRAAAAVVSDRAANGPEQVLWVRVECARRALAVMAARFYGTPAAALDIVGFTGTFGKTSTSGILRALLAAGGFRPGVLGSLGARYGGFHDPGNGLTTPAPVELHRALRGLADAGADTVIMEVTSHALRRDRVHGLSFDGGIIAAIVPGEHTDFHRTFEDYVAAKRLFLDYLSPGAVLAFDADNPAAAALAAEAQVATRMGVSLEGRDAALQLRNVALDHTGARFVMCARAPDDSRTRASDSPQPMHSTLLGRGHLHNVALALAYATAVGVAPADAAAVLSTLTPLRRRMEQYVVEGRSVLDDTAAHPESFDATFEVADLLAAGLSPRTRCRVAVVYAIRGNRGVDINRRNALALADLASAHRVDSLVVTAASDAVGDVDRASPEEIDAARDAFVERGRSLEWHDTLRSALRAALHHTRAGDLIVLVGAQGMDEGKQVLVEESTLRA